MLEVRTVGAAYGQHLALHQVSLQVGPGEVVVMLGANGAGKTTLLKSLAGLVKTLPGSEIRLGGRALHALPSHERVEAGLALVPEGRGIFGELTVRENLEMGAFPRRARAHRARNLERVVTLFPPLKERFSQAVRTMSGGEQQMVAIGRALMSQPTALLLDEPSLGLSPLMTGELFKALASIRSEGDVSVLLIEQNAKKGLAIADRGYLLENGRVAGEGAAKVLMDDLTVRRAYLGL
jgi:branched-chain amino acid transport system ATP-binding protein